MYKVALVRYEKPIESMRRVINLCGGLSRIPAKARVFLKPNIVYWTKYVPFPKWGVITTSQVVADIVELLAEHGINNITIGEGILNQDKDMKLAQHAFTTLGYNKLAERYGVKVINVFERPFKKVDLGERMYLFYNIDAINSDFIVTLPVLKTHAQTVVSLGIKNLKGLINLKSRKQCHSADPYYNLHFWLARLTQPLPPILAVLDGIYSAERGPSFDGIMHRTNLLIASWDVLSADLVGARLLGQDPSTVPHLSGAAILASRSLDLSDVNVVGLNIEDEAQPYQWSFPYNDDSSLPLSMVKKGITGIHYYKYDSSMCTYCSKLNSVILMAIARAWRGQPWDNIEVLTGKIMRPQPGVKNSILLGKCMYLMHKDNPNIKRMFAVKGCPPDPKEVAKVLQQAGIMIDSNIFRNIDLLPSLYNMQRYLGKPEFDESLFQISNNA